MRRARRKRSLAGRPDWDRPLLDPCQRTCEGQGRDMTYELSRCIDQSLVFRRQKDIYEGIEDKLRNRIYLLSEVQCTVQVNEGTATSI